MTLPQTTPTVPTGPAPVPFAHGALPADAEAALLEFVSQSAFRERGGIITDLDGTVVFESQGTTLLSPAVEHALKSLYELGRPLMLNSLRFPGSVLRTFGADWYRLSNAPIPTVSLNGSQIGYIQQSPDGALEFEELDAFPLEAHEIEVALKEVETLLGNGINDVLLFHYPRDWRQGEVIWTPNAERIDDVKQRYPSASSVLSSDIDKLRTRLLTEDLCMIFLLVDVPHDVLMAYQHTQRSSFFTRTGVNKLTGAQALAARLNIDLEHSLGAGDTEMDTFLSGVGLSVHVGPQPLTFEGTRATVRLRDAGELAAMLYRLGTLERDRLTSDAGSTPSTAAPNTTPPKL